MKRNFFLFLFLIGTLVVISVFHACSSNDSDEQTETRTQFLLKKSKELGQKYGVDMTLDETNIEKNSKTLTVEQMEKDYKDWASFSAHLKLKSTTEVKSAHHLRLVRRRAMFETTATNGHYENSADNNNKIYVVVDYNFGNKGNGLVHVHLRYKNSEGESSFIPIGYILYGSNVCSFTAKGYVFISGGIYRGTMQVDIERKRNGDLVCNVIPL